MRPRSDTSTRGGDVPRVGPGPIDRHADRQPRPRVENAEYLPGPQAEPPRHGRQIDQPDVIRAVGVEAAVRPRGREHRAWRLAVPPDGLAANAHAGAGERLGDTAVAAEAPAIHLLHEIADHVGVAPEGRRGAQERADRAARRRGSRFLEPAADGRGRDEEPRRGAVVTPIDGSVAVSVSAQVEIAAPAPIDPASVTPATVRLLACDDVASGFPRPS